MEIAEADVAAFARGCAVFGAGGGGDVGPSRFLVEQALRECGPTRLISVEQLPDEGVVMPLCMIGAPSVSLEKLSSGTEVDGVRAAVERYYGLPVVALMASEIGGGNGVLPLGWAARAGLPLLDADCMGRAFPEVDMNIQNVVGAPQGPVVLGDERGNVVTATASDGPWAELIARTVAEVFGAAALMADCLMFVEDVPGTVVEGSVSRALALGRAIHEADEPVSGLIAALGAVRLVTGKVVDVERRTAGGFVRGSVLVEGHGEDQGRLARIEIQNENLVFLEDGQVRACVPDLITLVDTQTADAVSNELVRYGQRVSVLAIGCDPLWRTERGLQVAGPRRFGYDFDYEPAAGLYGADA